MKLTSKYEIDVQLIKYKEVDSQTKKYFWHSSRPILSLILTFSHTLLPLVHHLIQVLLEQQEGGVVREGRAHDHLVAQQLHTAGAVECRKRVRG